MYVSLLLSSELSNNIQTSYTIIQNWSDNSFVSEYA
jgi:hypothetical protein